MGRSTFAIGCVCSWLAMTACTPDEDSIDEAAEVPDGAREADVGLEPYVTIASDFDRRAVKAEAAELARSRGMAPEVAHVLLERQEDFHRVRSRAELLFPESFAGAWLTDQPGGGRLLMAFTELAEHSAGQAAAEVSTAGHCADTLNHSDVRLRHVEGMERSTGTTDVQFHTRNGFVTSRWVYNRPDQQNYGITGKYTGQR